MSPLSPPLSSSLSPSSFINKAQSFVLTTEIRKKWDICKPNETCMSGSYTPSKAEANCVLLHSKQMTVGGGTDLWSEWGHGLFVKEIRGPVSSYAFPCLPGGCCCLIPWAVQKVSARKVRTLQVASPWSDLSRVAKRRGSTWALF